MTHNRTFTTIIACSFFALAYAGTAVSSALAKDGQGRNGGGNGGGNAGGGKGGDPEAVYTAAGDLINADSIDSTNLNFDEIIFRPSADFTFDLSGFGVADPGGGYCPGFDSETTGTLVLAPGDSAIPDSAELRFGFQGQLSDNGKIVQHFLVMQGTLSGDWPPTDVTTLTFSSWELFAENRKSRRSDCQGEGDGLQVIIGISPATPEITELTRRTGRAASSWAAGFALATVGRIPRARR